MIYMYLGAIEIPLFVGPTSEDKSESRRLEQLQPSFGPALVQDAGDGEQSYRLTFRVHRQDTDPKAFYDRLVAAKESAEILPIVYSNGEYHGDWAIKELSRSGLITSGDRSWICVDIVIDLIPVPDGSIVISDSTTDKGDAVTVHDSDDLSSGDDADFDNTARW